MGREVQREVHGGPPLTERGRGERGPTTRRATAMPHPHDCTTHLMKCATPIQQPYATWALEVGLRRGGVLSVWSMFIGKVRLVLWAIDGPALFLRFCAAASCARVP